MKKILTFLFACTIALTPVASFAQISQGGGQDLPPFSTNGNGGQDLSPTGTGPGSGRGFDCNNNITDLASFLGLFTCLISSALIPLLFAVAILVFIWGVVQFISNADNEEKRTQGRNFMVYGIIALFVMVSVWGLVNVLSNTFGVKTFIPQLQSQ